MIRIDGLNDQQIAMLDKMWTFDTSEELLEWFKTLDDEEFHMAVTLQEMVIDAMLEQPAESDTKLAQDMLRSIGVKC